MFTTGMAKDAEGQGLRRRPKVGAVGVGCDLSQPTKLPVGEDLAVGERRDAEGEKMRPSASSCPRGALNLAVGVSVSPRGKITWPSASNYE